MSSAMPFLPSRFAKILYRISTAAYGAALGFGITWFLFHKSFAMQFAAPLRYLGDACGLLFLILSSAWGWKRWSAVMFLAIGLRGYRLLSKLQHWGTGDIVEIALYGFIFLFYTFHFVTKSTKRRVDYLKLCWVWLSCATIGFSYMQMPRDLWFCVALALSGLLQVIVVLQLLQLRRESAPGPIWDFNKAPNWLETRSA